MDEFEIAVSYNGRDITLPVRLQRWGYIHRLEVTIGETPIFFEPDEEGSYRAISEGNEDIFCKVERGLIELIITKLT